MCVDFLLSVGKLLVCICVVSFFPLFYIINCFQPPVSVIHGKENTLRFGGVLNKMLIRFPFLSQHLYNSAAFKARTKARSKCRDKRTDVGEIF